MLEQFSQAKWSIGSKPFDSVELGAMEMRSRNRRLRQTTDGRRMGQACPF